jgi:hypothetical protein
MDPPHLSGSSCNQLSGRLAAFGATHVGKYVTEPRRHARARPIPIHHPLSVPIGLGAIGTDWIQYMQQGASTFDALSHAGTEWFASFQSLSDPDLQFLIKADCTVPGSRRDRSERDVFSNVFLSPALCA